MIRFSIFDLGFWMGRTKRVFRFAVGTLLFTQTVSVYAQQLERIPRIGYLPSAGAPIPRQFKALQEGLRDLGYVEGKNILIESRHSDGKLEAQDLVKELLQLKVDVLIAVDPTSLRAPSRPRRTSRS